MAGITCARCGGLNFRADRAVCHSCEPSPPASTSASPSANGAALYRRVLEQQRRAQQEARRGAPLATNSSSDALMAIDEKLPVGSTNSAAWSVSAVETAAATGFRPNKRPRAARDVIDLISSSDDDDSGNDKTSASANKGQQTAVDTRQQLAANNASVAAAASAARGDAAIDRIPTPASVANVVTDPRRVENDGNDDRASVQPPPYLSRSFSPVLFNADDFPTLDIAAAALRARRNSSAQETVVDTTAVPVPTTASPSAQTSEPQPTAGATTARVQVPAATQEPAPRPPQPTPLSAKAFSQSLPTPAARANHMVDDPVSINEPFQSRVFHVIEFNARDFSTVHDGLNVARRSKLSGPTEVPEEPTGDGPEKLEPPAPVAPSTSTVVIPPPSSSEPVAPQPTGAVPSVGPPDTSANAALPTAPVRENNPVQLPSGLPSELHRPASDGATAAQQTPFSAAPFVVPTRVQSDVPVVAPSLPPQSSSVLTPSTTTTTTPSTNSAVDSQPNSTHSPTNDSTTPSFSAESGSLPASATAPLQPPPPPPTTIAATATVLLPRKKTPENTVSPVARSNTGTEVVRATESASGSVAKVETAAQRLPAVIEPIAKPPLLGSCSADFLSFMKELVEGDDDDDDETRKLHSQLLEVVDLTNLTDSSDDDDDDSDGYVISEPPMPTGVSHVGVSGPHPPISGLVHPASSLSSTGAAGFLAGPALLPASATPAVGTEMPRLDHRRTVRQLEPCVICEEKRWVKTMIHCAQCTKYYHKKCAKEYGDDTICWNCELDGMIDDSEVTETSRDEVIGMLSTLRPVSSDDEDDDDGNDDGEEDEEGDDEHDDSAETEDADLAASTSNNNSDERRRDDGTGAGPRSSSQLPGSTTKAMQRWKAFLDVSTSTVDKSFQAVTSKIVTELQSPELKAKYSKGFTTPETFQAAISEVLDSYANLQDRLDREAREKAKTASSAAEAAAGAASDAVGTDTQPTAPAPGVASTASSDRPTPLLVVLDLSRSKHTNESRQW